MTKQRYIELCTAVPEVFGTHWKPTRLKPLVLFVRAALLELPKADAGALVHGTGAHAGRSE